MKKEKMSLEKMKGVLSSVLSRDEMKQVMAGSGNFCGGCVAPTGFYFCYFNSSGCNCPPSPSFSCA